MLSRFLLSSFLLFFYCTKAQNEFVTIWQPGLANVVTVVAPYQANDQQIWFPGVGQNYTIQWEEVGYPANNGTLTNVTSTNQVLIDFGPKREGSGSGTTYRVKISNGNGTFQQFKSASYQLVGSPDILYTPILQIHGSTDKLLEVEQWGNINWTSMSGAFANCQRMQITALDSPDLSNVTDASVMFYGAHSLGGSGLMQNWNTATIQNFSYMFSGINAPYSFVSPSVPFIGTGVGNWNTSSATNMSYMFAGQNVFNQNLNAWNVSNVTNMNWMFAHCIAFNQPLNSWNTSSLQKLNDTFRSATSFNHPLNNWDTSNVTTMDRTFSAAASFNQPLNSWNVSNTLSMSNTFNFATQFNQPLDSWNVSNVTNMTGIFANAGSFNQPLNTWNVNNVTNMGSMFGGAIAFNQPLNSWNVSNVTRMDNMFYNASAFNQSLGNWNLNSLINFGSSTTGNDMLENSGLDCENYSATLSGWADNPNTPNNINLGTVSPLQFASNVVAKRDYLINNKNWTISGDVQGNCILSTKDSELIYGGSIYPNPTSDFVYIKNIKNAHSFQIIDVSGRVVKQNELKSEMIDLQDLPKGSYLLLIKTKENSLTFKLIKK